MPLYITIAAAVTVAVTAKLMYLLFLSGRTITNATLFGRVVSRIEPARQAFVRGWRKRGFRYQLVAYPCMLASIGLVSLFLRWMMPALENTQNVSDKIRYCLLVFGIGVSATLTIAFLLIMLMYFLASLVEGLWRPGATGTVLDESADAAPRAEPEKADGDDVV